MDNRPSHARRRPESVQKNAQTGAVRRTPGNPAQSYSNPQYRAGQQRPVSSANRTGQPVQRTRTSGVQNGRPAPQNRNTAPDHRTVRNISADNQRNAVRRVDELTAKRDLERKQKAAAEAKKELALQKKSDKWLVRYQEDVKVQKADEIIEQKWQNEVVRYKGGLDFWLLLFAILLLVAGTVTGLSASYPLGVFESNDPTKYIGRQIIYTAAGLGIAFIAVLFPPKYYKNWLPFLIYAVGFGLLIAAKFIGTVKGETTRWIDFGPFNVQPSEIMKVGVIFVLAWYFDRFEKKIDDITLNFWPQFKYNIVIPGGILAIACGLIMLGKHLSGFAITAAIGGLMMIISTKRLKWLFVTVAPIAAAVIAGYLIANPYALLRITAAVEEEPDKLGAMYQTLQSINAIGSGGLLGVGFGESRQKYHFLTQSHTDFIFSIWCEETGFVGALALILLFLALIWRGYTVARRAPDKFTMLLAFGITTHIGIQAFLHMMVTTKMFFNTGVTLPFFSYGGSSLFVFMAEMGVLLHISRYYCKKKSDVEREQLMKQMGMY